MKSPSDLLDEILAENLSIDDLKHVYDPVKAKEYYERTKKLKGRRRASTVAPAGDRSGSSVAVPVRRRPNSLATKRAASKRRREELKARADKLKARLAKLEAILDELTAKAKARSGVKEDTPDKKSTTSKKSDSKPKTAAQKKKDAQAAKERRDREPQSAEAEIAKVQAQIKDVREKIQKMLADLAEAKRKGAARKKKQLEAQPATGRSTSRSQTAVVSR